MDQVYDKRMLLVYNPKAGKAQIKNKLFDIIDIFARGGYRVTACPTQKRGDAAWIVRNREEGYDLVVCSGGDGTLDEVVSGMMKGSFRTPIGYIPAGSTNDFGGSLALPKNMKRAAQTIVDGQNFACDVGKFNEDFFVYIAAFGLFTEVSYETDQDVKNVLGHMAYLLEGVKSLSNIRSYHMKITCGDQEIEDDFIYGMITNSSSVGGFKRITGKHVKLNDGEFEVTLIKTPRSALELNNIMKSLLNRDIDTDAMYCFRASSITLQSEKEVAWTLDGEFGGDHRMVEIQNVKEGIDIRVAEQA